jgi:hypothetical protein
VLELVREDHQAGAWRRGRDQHLQQEVRAGGRHLMEQGAGKHAPGFQSYEGAGPDVHNPIEDADSLHQRPERG